MSPLRRRRLWHWVPLLVVGVGALALLPAGQSSINHVDTVGKPATPVAAAAAAIAPPAAAAEPKVASTAAPIPPPAAPAANAPVNPDITQVAAITPATADASAGPGAAAAALPSTAQLSATDTTADATTQQSLPAGLTDGQIGSSAVNVRAGPSSGTDKRFVIQPGEAVKIGETNGSWVHIYRQDGSDGWVFGRYIAGHEPPPAPVDSSPAPTRSATADDVFQPPSSNLVGRHGEAHSLITARTGPSGVAPPAFLLQPGDRFRIAQSHRGWILIVTDDGMSGWIVA